MIYLGLYKDELDQKKYIYKDELKKKETENILTTNDDSQLIEDILTNSLNQTSIYAKKIELQDNKYSFDEIKLVIRKLWYVDNVLRFYINKNTSIKGKVTNLIEAHKQKIPIVRLCRTKSQQKDSPPVDQLYFFDERIDKRYTGSVIDSLDEEFWMYQMTAKKKQYVLLSREELNLEEYNIDGMTAEINDYSDIANYSKLTLRIPIIFVNTSKKRIINIKSHEEFFNFISKYDLNEDKLMRYLFSLKVWGSAGKQIKYFQHPREFERLIAAWLFSAKFDASPYPLHLMMIGDPGVGKSKILECLFEKMQETNQITDGSCSTIKTLIPSFKGSTPKVGDLLQANRIAFVDEFLRILMRIDSDEREPMLTTMNPLLEHKYRRFGSGNSEMEGQMTSKFISGTNPAYGTSTMSLLCKRIDTSFLSRLLIYYFDQGHSKLIREKTEQDLLNNDFWIEIDDWLSIYDYLNSFQSILNHEDLNKIFKESLRFFGKPGTDIENDKVRDQYSARYRHHLSCLADGIIKLRCVCIRDQSFEMKNEDYNIIKFTWETILESWNLDITNIEEEKIINYKKDSFFG